jgi:hypothetical protein
VTVLKVLELLNSMDPDRRDAVRDAIRGHVKTAVHKEVFEKLAGAIEAASKAGMTDEEILDYVGDTLRERARDQRIANAIRYRRHPLDA